MAAPYSGRHSQPFECSEGELAESFREQENSAKIKQEIRNPQDFAHLPTSWLLFLPQPPTCLTTAFALHALARGEVAGESPVAPPHNCLCAGA